MGLARIQSGQNLGQTLRAGVGAALDTARTKAQGFGAGVKSVCNDIKSAIAHPVQTIKVTLGQALQDAGDKAKEMGAKAQDAGEDMDAMGRRGGSAADSLGGKFSSLVKTIAGLAILKQAVSWIKDLQEPPSMPLPMLKRPSPSLKRSLAARPQAPKPGSTISVAPPNDPSKRSKVSWRIPRP